MKYLKISRNLALGIHAIYKRLVFYHSQGSAHALVLGAVLAVIRALAGRPAAARQARERLLLAVLVA